MAQLTIYLPDELEQRVRKEAKRSKKSLSAFMAELAAAKVGELSVDERRKRLDALWGSLSGDFPDEIPELPARLDE